MRTMLAMLMLVATSAIDGERRQQRPVAKPGSLLRPTLWQRYSFALQGSPVVGNMLTGAILALAGDAIMQVAEHERVFDGWRSLRFVTFRLAVCLLYTSPSPRDS